MNLPSKNKVNMTMLLINSFAVLLSLNLFPYHLLGPLLTC